MIASIRPVGPLWSTQGAAGLLTRQQPGETGSQAKRGAGLLRSPHRRWSYKELPTFLPPRGGRPGGRRGKRGHEGSTAADSLAEPQRVSWELRDALKRSDERPLDGGGRPFALLDPLRPSRTASASKQGASPRSGVEPKAASSESPAPQRIAWMSEHGIYAQLVVDGLVQPRAFLSLETPVPAAPAQPAGVARLLGRDTAAGDTDHRRGAVSPRAARVLRVLSGPGAPVPLREAVDLRMGRGAPVGGCWFGQGRLHGLDADAGYVGVRWFVYM